MRNTPSFTSLIFASSLALTNATVYPRGLVPPQIIGDGWEYQGCPTFTLTNIDWSYGATIPSTLGSAPQNGNIEVSLLGSVSSTHGNSMGARTLFPEISCQGTNCEVVAPPDGCVCPPGWYHFFVLDRGIPAVGVYVRIGGDPAGLGEWPEGEDFSRPGMEFPARK